MIAEPAIYTDSLSQTIHIAGQLAKEGMYPEYSPAHILKAMLHKSLPFRKALYKDGKDVFYMEEWADVKIEQLKKSGGPVSSPRASNQSLVLLEKAEKLKEKKGLEQVSPDEVLEALTIPGVAFSFEELKTFPISYLELSDPEANESNGSAVAHTNSNQKTNQNYLQNYCELLTAPDSTFDEVVARNMEIRQMCEILARRSKSNILITGEPGVGKTSLARGLAATIKKGNVPMFLKNSPMYELKLGLLLAGATYKGEVEDRVRGIIQELKDKEGGILFIDEIHTIIDEKQGYSGVVNMLKPELASGQLMLVAATNTENYRKTIERDDALSRRFEVIQLLEPDTDKALRMLKAVIPAYEEHHSIQADAEALDDAINLSKRYMRERKLPDAAIDLIDRTMAVKKLANSTSEEDIQALENELLLIIESEESDHLKKEQLSHYFQDLRYQVSPILFELTSHEEFDYDSTLEDMNSKLQTILNEIREMLKTQTTAIKQEDIAAVVASKSGVPVGKINTGEQQRLLDIEDELRKRVVGQNHAIHVVSEAIKESRSGLANPKQPIGSFFFLGPTGTGKTELAKTLAEFLFYDDTRIIRFDMSEFKEEHSAALLHGAPPGYVGYEEGGMLVNKIRKQPYSIVLFDEIEKAHPSVFDLFLQILDEGKLNDRLGKEGDFTNSIVLFTSNIASDFVVREFEKNEVPESDVLLEKMSSHFRPEFLGRLTEIVPFAPISKESVIRIFDIQMKQVHRLLEAKGIQLTVTEKAKAYLAEKGYTPKYGARPVKKIIRQEIRRPMARKIISGELAPNASVTLDINEKNEIFWI